jgi:hypothetical protein
MSGLAKKRTIDAFFKPPTKKPRVEGAQDVFHGSVSSSEPVEEQVSCQSYVFDGFRLLTIIYKEGRAFWPFYISISDSMFSEINRVAIGLSSFNNWESYE